MIVRFFVSCKWCKRYLRHENPGHRRNNGYCNHCWEKYKLELYEKWLERQPTGGYTMEQYYTGTSNTTTAGQYYQGMPW